MSPLPTGMLLPGHLLSVKIEACSVFPPRPLDAYPTRRHPRYPDKTVGGLQNCGGEPTPYIAECTGLLLPPLGG